MDKIVIRHKGLNIFYIFVGTLFLIASCCLIVNAITEKDASDLFRAILYFIPGLFFVTLNFGTLHTCIEKRDDLLIIRWYSVMRKIKLPVAEIKEITGNDHQIIIIKHEGKPLKLSTAALEFEEHRSVVKFLREALETEKHQIT